MLLALMLLATTPQGCTSPRSQVTMNRCADLEARAADVDMAREWKATFAYMKGRDARDPSRGGGFGYAAALLESQRAWLRFRDTQCVIEGGQFAGGSGQPMARSRCMTGLAKARVQQLRGLRWSR